jgi:hypothetical protein
MGDRGTRHSIRAGEGLITGVPLFGDE